MPLYLVLYFIIRFIALPDPILNILALKIYYIYLTPAAPSQSRCGGRSQRVRPSRAPGPTLAARSASASELYGSATGAVRTSCCRRWPCGGQRSAVYVSASAGRSYRGWNEQVVTSASLALSPQIKQKCQN